MSIRLTAIALTLEAMKIGETQSFSSSEQHVHRFITRRTGLHTWSVSGGDEGELIDAILKIEERLEVVI